MEIKKTTNWTLFLKDYSFQIGFLIYGIGHMVYGIITRDSIAAMTGSISATSGYVWLETKRRKAAEKEVDLILEVAIRHRDRANYLEELLKDSGQPYR